MLREFNYTRRQRILREDVDFQIIRTPDGGLSFNADLRLDKYQFDKVKPVPKVFVEAYRGATATWKRFSFGDAESISAPDDLSLNEFRVPEGILFRVRVTSVDAGKNGRLLGEADALSPRTSPDGEGFVQPLIQHMAADDIGDELWRIHYSDSLPILKINDRLQIGVDQFLITPTYRAVYAPAVMRQVLQRILLIERSVGDEEDPDDWRQRWLRFCTSLTGRSAPEFEGEASIEVVEEWISEATEIFSRSGRMLSTFNSETSS